MEKCLRSRKIIGISNDMKNTIEMPSTSKDNEKPSQAPSLRSARSALSTASQKTLLQARARRELAELERARIENEKVLLEAKLNEEIAVLEADNDIRAASENGEGEIMSDVQQWVDRTITAQQMEAPDTTTRPHPCSDIALLAQAITDTLKLSRNPAPVGDKLIGRLSAKDLPTFSGDALDWLRFKNAFITTTKIGQYTDEENVARLQRCLIGEAWEAVAARLITATSAEDIMKTLEIRFGRPDLVLHKLIGDVKKLPKLTGARSELVVLATKVSNCVAAIEATRNKDYLYSPELSSEVMSKLTEPLIYRWLDYWATMDGDQPRLSALAKYLMQEAEQVCKAGIVELPQKAKISPATFKRPVLSVSEGTSINVATEKTRKESTCKNCMHCGKADHEIDKCPTFQKLDIMKRWDWVCDKKLCFKCLSTNHRRDRCRRKKICATCNRGHHTLLHRDDWIKPENTEEPTPSVPRPETAANLWARQSKTVYLKVLPILIEGPAGCLQTYALLDEGSTVTLIERHVAEAIGAEGPLIDLNLRGAVGDSLKAPSYNVMLTVKTPDGDYQLDRVRTVDKLTLPTQSLDSTELASLQHLSGIPLQTFKGKPTMIIGQDYWYLIVSREVREGRKNEPVASLTRLGWVLHGFASGNTKQMIDHSCHVSEGSDEDLHELVKSYFRLESIGVKHEEGLRSSSEERRALNILDTKSNKIGDKWEAGLLWRSDDVELPDNRQYATSRLKTIEKSMDADAAFAADYTKQVVNMLEKGYAEKVTGPITGRRVWFLPHFGVRNPNKPGKLRLVFDAKAKYNGVSLNSELLSGPDLLNSLIGVLLRFRERAVAVTGDIREMFLQVKIIKEDQHAQCFLWRGMDRINPPRTFKMTSMTFGATSSPCTATYILRRNAEQYLTSQPRAVEAIRRRHYVDDYLDSADTEEEMRRLIADVAEIHKAGGFEIRGWASNRPHVLPQLLNTPTISLIQEAENESRTLGLIWKSEQDLLGFDVSLKKVDREIARGLRRPTKREMLKVIMSVFDPLGFLCPVMIRGKILLQDIWRSGVQWDQQIGEKAADEWFRWLREIKKCHNFSIPRCYGFSSLNDLQLHVFVDASEQAYSSVAYLRREGEVSFVAAKSRVSPLKSSTIPRLELQAALMGTRLGVAIMNEQDVNITKRYFWTDSQTVWWWIRNNPKKRLPFVSHRLSEIDDLTRPEEWRWLPGRLNAADGATRSEGTLETVSSKWIRGPEFLYEDEEKWPSVIPQAAPQTEEEPTEAIVAVIVQHADIVDYTRFSNWRRMLRSVAAVIVFTERCKKLTTHLSPEHERRAEKLILRQVQAESFPEELQAVRNNTNLHLSSRLRQIYPRLDDDGLLRVKGRIVAGADLPLGMTEPIILDGRHHMTRMMLVHKHKELGHHSMETLINEVRQKFYVLRLRHTVRSIIAQCVTCKARRGRCEQPVMAGLPPARLHHHCRPFTYCGVDLFGPMLVTIGRRNEKRWGVLFTCMNTRAVSIELAASLSADSTLLAIRRMAARRGLPKQMYSDNGTNFRAADKELQAGARGILNDGILVQETEALGIEWRYNPADAAHMGGVWEILVRSIKTALYATLRSRAPKEEVLATLIAEAENIVNSRPLTHVTLDPNEEESLTPNHFLLGGSSALPRPGEFSDQDLHLRRQWRIAQRLTDHFWSRWIREYLPCLQERRKWTRDSGHNIGVGDIVLIADSSSPRNVWPRGRVTATTPGRDGRVRIVDVATRGGVLRRPAAKVVVLLRAGEPLPASTTDAADAASQRGGDCG